MSMDMSIAEMTDVVPVKNRMDVTVIAIHNAKELVFEPGEVKQIVRAYAQFVVNKSTIKRTLKGKAKVQKLVILGIGKDESPLRAADYAGPQQLVDKPWFDNDGTPLKERYVDINETGVEAVVQKVEAKETAKQEAAVAAQRAATAEKVQPNVAKAADALEAEQKATA